MPSPTPNHRRSTSRASRPQKTTGSLDHAIRTTDTDRALRLAEGLVGYWFLRGRLTEARRSFAAALALPGDSPTRASAALWQTSLGLVRGDDRLPDGGLDTLLAGLRQQAVPAGKRARLLWGLAFGNQGFGDPATTDELLDLALRELEPLGDEWGTAAALSLRATLRRARSELAGAAADARAAELRFQRLGDRWGLLRATSTLAELAEIDGAYERAAELHRTGLRLAEELELPSEVSFKLSGLGRIALLTGDLRGADELHDRARRLAISDGNEVAEEFAEIGLALSARRQGRLDDAEYHLRRWLDWLRRVDGEPGLALVLAELGFIAELRGDEAAALSLHLESQSAAERIGDRRAIALALEGQAGAHSLAGRSDGARRLLAEADTLRAAAGAPLPQAELHDRTRITTRVVDEADSTLFT